MKSVNLFTFKCRFKFLLFSSDWQNDTSNVLFARFIYKYSSSQGRQQMSSCQEYIVSTRHKWVGDLQRWRDQLLERLTARKAIYCVEYVSDVRRAGAFASTKARLKGVWARRMKARLLFVMWRIRIKVQALVLPGPLYSPVQMWPFPILRSVKQTLRGLCEQWKRVDFVFSWTDLRKVWVFFFPVQMTVSAKTSPVTGTNTVILPQVMVCTGGRRNNLLQEVQCPMIHRLPGPSSSW